MLDFGEKSLWGLLSQGRVSGISPECLTRAWVLFSQALFCFVQPSWCITQTSLGLQRSILVPRKRSAFCEEYYQQWNQSSWNTGQVKCDHRSLKVGELFLKRTEEIAASWEGGVNQAETRASDTVKALAAFVLCTPSLHWDASCKWKHNAQALSESKKTAILP